MKKIEISNRSSIITRDGKLLNKVCKTCELIDTFREKIPNDYGFTRFDSQTKTRIDRIYVKKKLKQYSIRPSS